LDGVVQGSKQRLLSLLFLSPSFWIGIWTSRRKVQNWYSCPLSKSVQRTDNTTNDQLNCDYRFCINTIKTSTLVQYIYIYTVCICNSYFRSLVRHSYLKHTLHEQLENRKSALSTRM
jgi:hypothetical protein